MYCVITLKRNDLTHYRQFVSHSRVKLEILRYLFFPSGMRQMPLERDGRRPNNGMSLYVKQSDHIQINRWRYASFL